MLEMKDKGVTIIFSTHRMEQVEMICDNICLINKGEKVLEGNLNRIKKEYGEMAKEGMKYKDIKVLLSEKYGLSVSSIEKLVYCRKS